MRSQDGPASRISVPSFFTPSGVSVQPPCLPGLGALRSVVRLHQKSRSTVWPPIQNPSAASNLGACATSLRRSPAGRRIGRYGTLPVNADFSRQVQRSDIPPPSPFHVFQIWERSGRWRGFPEEPHHRLVVGPGSVHLLGIPASARNQARSPAGFELGNAGFRAMN